jgi:hypothetical protein
MPVEDSPGQVLRAWSIAESEADRLASADGLALVALLCNAGAKRFPEQAPALYALKPHLVWQAARQAAESWYIPGPHPEDPLVVGNVLIQTTIPVPWAPEVRAQFGFHVHADYDWASLGDCGGRLWAGHSFQTPEAIEALLGYFGIRRPAGETDSRIIAEDRS